MQTLNNTTCYDITYYEVQLCSINLHKLDNKYPRSFLGFQENIEHESCYMGLIHHAAAHCT